MRTRLALAVLGASLAAIPHQALAQWKTETYALKGGWNAIWLHGDASYATPSELFASYPTVLEIWRWNPNPDQIQYSDTPATPDATSSEWTIWNRNDTAEQKLTAMVGQSAYLVRVNGASTTTLSLPIKQRPMPPAATWLISGANFIGVPANSTTPTMASYFSTFPVATTSPSKVYKYIGGDLGAANPLLVATTSERLDRNTAYWFEATTVGDFTAPVEYELPTTGGLAFGRTGSYITMGIKNRTTGAITLTFSTQNSETAPTGQLGVTGPVPLTRRVYDSATNTYTESAITGSFTVSVPASGRLDLQFGLDRTQLGASSASFFASLLRVKDSGNFSDVFIPASAQVSTPAGLWIGEADVSSVTSTVAGSPGSTTSRSFPLRLNIHVDASGVARLLSQAYVGTLASGGHPAGVATVESALYSETKDSALRLVSSQMPLDRVITGSGSFAVGSTLTCVVNLPHDDPTNPFVHTYHPDHDNRDARLAPLAAGVESYTITRTCRFTFTATPPDGSTVTGWGSTVYGGTYSETIEGLNRNPLTVGGTFVMRRVSEIATLTTQ